MRPNSGAAVERERERVRFFLMLDITHKGHRAEFSAKGKRRTRTRQWRGGGWEKV
jgi:hypothetical protein